MLPAAIYNKNSLKFPMLEFVLLFCTLTKNGHNCDRKNFFLSKKILDFLKPKEYLTDHTFILHKYLSDYFFLITDYYTYTSHISNIFESILKLSVTDSFFLFVV